MVSKLILLVAAAAFIWLIKRDIGRREGISLAIWIPTLWVGIIASRPLSAWLGVGGGEDSLEGSPFDRLFFLGLIIAALITLARRKVNWSQLVANNWPLFLFYGYLLVSITWADPHLVCLKRWFKEFGNIFVVLVILTEADPLQAFRAVFVRCAYVLLPLSVIFIRYFPDLGRRYTIHSGQLEPVGVTLQKNSLGALVLVCGLVLIWDWFERSRAARSSRPEKVERYLLAAFFLIGAYLLYLCDSKTSIFCLVVGGCILAATRMPLLRERMGALGAVALAVVVLFFALDSAFGIKQGLIEGMGRDMTFTGRTDVWHELLALKTDPMLGTGFCSFWSDERYQSKLSEEISGGRSAHNGYLETYLDGGMVGLFFLAVMLLGVGLKINRALGEGGDYDLIRFAVLAAVLIGNVAESHFGRMSPLGFLFLLAAIGDVESAAVPETSAESLAESQELPLSEGETNAADDSDPVLNGT